MTAYDPRSISKGQNSDMQFRELREYRRRVALLEKDNAILRSRLPDVESMTAADVARMKAVLLDLLVATENQALDKNGEFQPGTSNAMKSAVLDAQKVVRPAKMGPEIPGTTQVSPGLYVADETHGIFQKK